MDFPTGVELHNGKIRISFTYRGTRCREVLKGWTVTQSNLRKAGNLRAVIVSEIHLGQFDYAARFPESKALAKFSSTKRITTFKELADIFRETKALDVAASSMNSINSSINTLLRVVGENTYIADIKHVDILNYRKKLLTGEVINPGKPYLNKTGRAPSTVNLLMSLLSEMLKLAMRSQFITHEPYKGIAHLKVSRKRPDPLGVDEYQQLISAMPEKHRLIWIVAVHTGLRHGELCALSWSDVDLVKGEIHVSRNLTDKGLFVPPKTDAGIRTVTLLQPALEALKEQFTVTGHLEKKEICFHHREHGMTERQDIRFVFVPQNTRKKGHFSKSAISYGWRRGIEKSGIRERHPYQSRHTYACWTLAAGANPSFIASQMGHENAKMVYEVYSRWISDNDNDQVNMLNERMPTTLPPNCPKARFVLKKVV